MSRIVVFMLALLLVACAPSPSPQVSSSANSSPGASKQVLPSLPVIPTAPPQHSSDSMRAVLTAFREIGIELTTNDNPSNGELVLKANVDDDNIRIVLASAAGDQYQLRTSSVTIGAAADPDKAAEVRGAFAAAAEDLSTQETAASFFGDDLTAEEGGRSLTVEGKDGHEYELTSFFDNGNLELGIAYAGNNSLPPSATETEEATASD